MEPLKPGEAAGPYNDGRARPLAAGKIKFAKPMFFIECHEEGGLR
jgi:hypothetical protein